MPFSILDSVETEQMPKHSSSCEILFLIRSSLMISPIRYVSILSTTAKPLLYPFSLGAGARNIPRYSDVEIGGGRITGTEYKPGSKEGLAFGMYHAGQYAAPEGPHQKVHSADGTLWFKQYAQDAVERKPYKAPDGTVAYEEKIVKKLPNAPKRKDRI